MIMKEFDKIYVAKYSEILTMRQLADDLRTNLQEIKNIIKDLQEKELFETYKNISDEEWEILEHKTDEQILTKYLAKSQKYCNKVWQDMVKEMKPEKIKFEVFDDRKYSIDNKVYIEIQNEIWKDIEGSTYQISNCGRIKNTITDKILYGKLDRGTLRVKFSIKGMIKSQSIARIVAKVFLGGITDSQTILHKDGNTLNNKVENLLIIDKREKYKMMGKQSGEKRKFREI